MSKISGFRYFKFQIFCITGKVIRGLMSYLGKPYPAIMVSSGFRWLQVIGGNYQTFFVKKDFEFIFWRGEMVKLSSWSQLFYFTQVEDFLVDFQSLWNFKRDPSFTIQGYTMQDRRCYILPRLVFVARTIILCDIRGFRFIVNISNGFPIIDERYLESSFIFVSFWTPGIRWFNPEWCA